MSTPVTPLTLQDIITIRFALRTSIDRERLLLETLEKLGLDSADCLTRIEDATRVYEKIRDRQGRLEEEEP